MNVWAAMHSIHPGLVESWNQSRHSIISPALALQKKELERRISSDKIDSTLMSVTVGCYECHSLNAEKHKDSFEHNGYKINVVVSSDDCSTCHSAELQQYSKNMMSYANTNLVNNAVYRDLMKSVNGQYHYTEGNLVSGDADELTEHESCLYCHGTKIEVTDTVTKETDYGALTFPVLSGWPNQGVGRINPDGSLGSCTSCHPRHDFSIETARKPYTCSECHKGPDVPAYKVYEVSKHGNIMSSKGKDFSFSSVPWVVGKDFTAPTCASCHASLLVSPENTIIAERTHQFNDRLAWRLFGSPYSHPHPLSSDLKDVVNSQSLPLIVELDGKPVEKFVISADEQLIRNSKMKGVCSSCHSSNWVDNHFTRLENTIKKTNEITYEGTKMLIDLWAKGDAAGLTGGKNMFDEEAERIWTSLWLFHTNSIRFTSAMAGGGDYGVFADGRYQLTDQLYKMMEMLKAGKK